MALTILSQPSEFSWSRHPMPLKVSTDYAGAGVNTVAFQLLDSGSVLIDEIELDFADGEAEFDFSRWITDQLSYDTPTPDADAVTDTEVCKGFFLKVIEYVDNVEADNETTALKYALLGAQDYMLDKRYYSDLNDGNNFRFLTAKPGTSELYEWQEELISAIFFAAQVDVTFRVTLHFTDDTSAFEDVDLGAVAKGSVVHCSISDRQIGYAALTPEGKVIKHIEYAFLGLTGGSRYYRLKTGGKYAHGFLFRNKKGGIDSLAATGENLHRDKTQGELTVDENSRLQISSKPTVDYFTQYSGNVDPQDVFAYADMRDINRVWKVLSETELEAITLLPGETLIKKDGDNLKSFAFEYAAGDGRQNYNIIEAIGA